MGNQNEKEATVNVDEIDHMDVTGTGKITEAEKKIIQEVYGFNEEKYNMIMAQFKSYSKNGKTIDRDVMVKFLKQEVVGELAERIVRCFDKNNDGKIDLREFLLMMSATRSDNPTQTARGLFKIYDKDDSGELDESELIEYMSLFARSRIIQIMNQLKAEAASDPTFDVKEFDSQKDTVTLTEAQQAEVVKAAKAIMAQFDTDKNGTISLDEFIKGCNGKHFFIFLKSIEETANTARIDII